MKMESKAYVIGNFVNSFQLFGLTAFILCY